LPQPTLELADIFRQHGPSYRHTHSLPLHHHRLMQAIETCRTPLLGGTVEWCDHCHFTHTRYRSCRNRHCPKCQGAAREQWLEDRRAELLPAEYFHVVFTLPQQIASLAFYNKKLIYGILFRMEEVKTWQGRPLDAVYPIVYLDHPEREVTGSIVHSDIR
jgi:hypothetical protein